MKKKIIGMPFMAAFILAKGDLSKIKVYEGTKPPRHSTLEKEKKQPAPLGC